jgi:hypothetical protein
MTNKYYFQTIISRIAWRKSAVMLAGNKKFLLFVKKHIDKPEMAGV